MTHFVRPLLLSAMLACCTGPALPLDALAQAPNKPATEVPLQGEAWRLANAAYASYRAERFAQSATLAESAIRLRSDVLRLRMLLIYSLQKAGKLEAAQAAADDAIRGGFDSPALREVKANLRPAPAGTGNPSSAAWRKGFPIATQAYADYNSKEYVASARQAEAAFRIDPTQGAWAQLWLDALEAQGKYAEAANAADTALSLGAPNRNGLIARRQTLRRRMAVIPAQKGYQALIANDPHAAVPFAREAVSLAPDIDSHRLLLMTSLMLDNQLSEAEDAATDALGQDDGNTVALVMRAYLRQRQGKTAAADADFDAALKQDWLDDGQRKNIRLIAADAALAAGDPKRVATLVAPLDQKDAAVMRRLRAANASHERPAQLTLASYPAPVQDCHDTPYGTSCELLPADAAGAGGASAQAYAAYARGDYADAVAKARKAAAADPHNGALQNLLTTALSAGNAAQMKEAEQRLNDALGKSPADATLLMQRGYLYQRENQPEKAVADFRAARATGNAPPTSILDEGYALANAGDKRRAVDTLKQAIDMNDAGKLALTPEQRFNTRSSVGGLSREWGATVSAGYRGARPAGAGLGGAAVTVPGDAVFGSAEVFWRPSMILNSTTRVFEVYGRLTQTLANGAGETPAQTVMDPCTNTPVNVNESVNNGLSGMPTTTGSLGIRFTPSTQYGLTFGLERQFNLGSATRSGTVTPASNSLRCRLSGRDPSNPNGPALGNPRTANYLSRAGNGGWLSYMTYGYYEGTTLRMDKPSWLTVEGYMQAGYSWQDMPAQFWFTDQTTGAQTARTSGRYKRDQLFAAYELRVGRSFRADVVSDRLVLFPYAVVGGDFLKENDRVEASALGNGSTALLGNGSDWSMGAGAGVNLRYWFREDHYDAPRSYIDWATQYRFNVGGGSKDRSKGLFMTVTLSY
ncbi:NfrA family protein [Trinickia sp.]|uniref:NfrA family protein n=1 Tax=Trinickia sp. TaxID=2571163 RepID=UPI003F80021F